MKSGDLVQGRFDVLRKLGRGGMAEVWQCHDRERGHKVAVKSLSSETFLAAFADDDEARFSRLDEAHARFRREAKLHSGISHRGVPEFYGTGSHGPDPFFVMEFVDGVSLHDFLVRHTLTMPVIAAVTVQIAEALTVVHDQVIVHRDLKPHNILIDHSGRVVLIDFGISLPLALDATRYTQPGATVGSVGYQAPEQLLGNKVSPATDLYALGCILYEMITGRPPFTGDRIVDAHLHDVPLPLSAYNINVNPAVEALTLALLAKRADDRPHSDAEVLTIMRRFLPNRGDPEPSPAFSPDPSRQFRLEVAASAHAAQGSPSGQKRLSPKGSPSPQWLSHREVISLLATLESAPDNADELAGLPQLVDTARRQWGPANPSVDLLRRRAAEHLHATESYAQALSLYEESCAVPQSQKQDQVMVELNLRITQCQIPLRNLAGALKALAVVADRLPRLPVDFAREAATRGALLASRLFEAGCVEAKAVERLLRAWSEDGASALDGSATHATTESPLAK